ncbi:MAG: RNA-binding S4 domain-containing protein [bacterium]
MKQQASDNKVRLDKWLWASRFFKTRSLASAAVSGGKVHCNGQRCKPSRTVNIGDELEIHRGLERYVVTVEGLSEKRGPAPVARTLYTETAESLVARENDAAMRKATWAGMKPAEHRPSGRDRGKIRQFRGKE